MDCGTIEELSCGHHVPGVHRCLCWLAKVLKMPGEGKGPLMTPWVMQPTVKLVNIAGPCSLQRL
jgi:hypothetical protein